MTPYIRALRAITATVFQRVYRPTVWVIGGSLVLLWIGIIILASSVTPWWLVFLVILIPLTLVATVLAVVLWLLSQRLFPRHLTRGERSKILEFSDKILRVAEIRATPVPIIVALIAKDIFRGKKSSYLEGIISDSTSLRDDFTTIRDMFV